MSIPAIGAIGSSLASAVTPTTAASATQSASGATGALGGTGASTGTDFGSVLANGINQLQQVQSNADNLAVQAATGDLNDVHDYMIASTEASLTTQLAVAVRDKALSAFNSIMQMPV